MTVKDLCAKLRNDLMKEYNAEVFVYQDVLDHQIHVIISFREINLRIKDNNSVSFLTWYYNEYKKMLNAHIHSVITSLIINKED